MTTALKVYRRSELEAISDGCLKRYHDLYLAGVDDSSDISLVGVAFARVKHEYILRLVDRRLPQDAEEAEQAFIEGVAITQLPARLIPELKEIWDFHTSKFALQVERFIATEERGVEGQVSFAPDLVLGHPEANCLEIVDDKSGHAPPPTEYELKRNFQAKTYSRYARDRWPGFSRYDFTIYAIRYNARVTVSFTQAELDRVDSEVQAAIATIELAKVANQWPAIPGPACRFCTLKCPVADNQLTLPKRLMPAQAEKLAPWLLVAEKQLRSLKASLKEYVKEHGPVQVGGGVEWALRPSTSRSYPVEAVLEALRKLKVDKAALELIIPNGELTLSGSALTKIIKAYPDLLPILQMSERQKTTFRFGAKAAGDVEDDDAD